MHPILLIVFLPLLAAIVAGLGNRMLGNTIAKSLTTGALFISCILSWPIFVGFLTGSMEVSVVPVLKWVESGTLSFDWALRVDALTAVMLVVITTVSALVHLYSWGYMEEDPDQPRFFAYLSLFTFAMLMLVTADNLVQMFFGWEGVGLASYLLIGFWFKKPSANAAAIKAFVVNRVGDLGFMLGIFGTWLVFQTTSIPEILAVAPGMTGSTIGFLGYRMHTMDILCVLLFIGAMGKSAQLGLHTWLPDAMEGPTPVSALIHAATMVTAGVFMVCRLSPMFEAAPVALSMVIFVGAATCFFAATIGTTQWDIKRVIAYSTCSQLGYMFFAAGVGAYGAAMFHLFTHAFFKALLFLGAGSVIMGMHHNQDIRWMGGVRKYMPITWITSLLGSLALIGTPLFSGFYSKDSIIEAVHESHLPAAGFANFAVLAGVFVTAFYSFRMYFLVFHGKERYDQNPEAHHDDDHHNDQHDDGKPHESPWVVTLPLVLLAIPSVLIGYFTIEPMLYGDFFKDAIMVNADKHPVMVELAEAFHGPLAMAEHALTSVPFMLAMAGVVVSWYMYLINPKVPAFFAKVLRPLILILENKYFMDWINENILARGARLLGTGLWKGGDRALIDGLLVNGSWKVVGWVSRIARHFQSGYLYHYALVMILGVFALMTTFVWLA